jgi:hypothetical protein
LPEVGELDALAAGLLEWFGCGANCMVSIRLNTGVGHLSAHAVARGVHTSDW